MLDTSTFAMATSGGGNIMAALGGQIILGRQEPIDLASAGASKHFRSVTLEEGVGLISSWIRAHDKDGRQTFIFGYGGQHKSLYDELEAEGDCTLLWSEFGGPKWIGWLGIVAGQYGLLQANNQDAFSSLAKRLAHRAMIGVLSVSQAGLSEVLSYLNKHKSKANPEIAVIIDTSAAVFILDNDNGESTTGTLLVEVYGSRARG